MSCTKTSGLPAFAATLLIATTGMAAPPTIATSISNYPALATAIGFRVVETATMCSAKCAEFDEPFIPATTSISVPVGKRV